MAVYGIGSFYDGTVDVSSEFFEQGCVCIGYDKSDATSLYEMLRRIKVGDIIYIKSFNPGKVFIKAIGFVIGRNIKEFYFSNNNDFLGYGRKVVWKQIFDKRDEWIEIELTPEQYKNNVYNNTLYEEYSVSIIEKILKQL